MPLLRGSPAAGVAVAVSAAVMTWLACAVTVEQLLAQTQPAVALAWGLGGARSKAALASQLAQPGASRVALDRGEALARSAMARSPVNVTAASAMARVVALKGRTEQADRLFAYSDRLSRRDLTTQLWLIEERVRVGDVPGALRHYDRALRTVAGARQTLFPVLATAASFPHVARPLAELLARRPGWALDFMAVLADSSETPPEALALFLERLRLDPNTSGEGELLASGSVRLASRGSFGAVDRLYRRARGRGRAEALLRDGDFEADPVLPPLDWTLARREGATAELEDRGGDGRALTFRVADGAGGELARQLLILRPGAYRLSGSAGEISAEPLAQPMLTVTCATGGQALRASQLGPVPDARSFQVDFRVRVGCPAQWLTISAAAGRGGDLPLGWVDRLRIERIGP